jgi:hypothetical protein
MPLSLSCSTCLPGPWRHRYRQVRTLRLHVCLILSLTFLVTSPSSSSRACPISHITSAVSASVSASASMNALHRWYARPSPFLYCTTPAVALYPLDLVKVRMQVFDGAGSRYSSLATAFRTIVATEGFTALYKVRATHCLFRCCHYLSANVCVYLSCVC